MYVTLNLESQTPKQLKELNGALNTLGSVR